MKKWSSLNNPDFVCPSPRQIISPHPPNEPCNGKNEAAFKIRQRRYRHQSSEQLINDQNLDAREIRSAGSKSFMKADSLQSEADIVKTKISSAPGPRSNVYEYRSSNFRREKSDGLYTFDSNPSLIQDHKDVQIVQRSKRKDQSSKDEKSIPTMNVMSPENNLTPILISKSFKPFKSQASPVTSDNQRPPFLVKRQSLQQISRERMSQLSRRSAPRSDLQITLDISNSSHLLSSLEWYGNEPINLNHYRSPNDVSDSFETKMLASLVAQSAQIENANNSSLIFPQLVNSKVFTNKGICGTDALVGGSFSDDETSTATTAPLTNRNGVISNQRLSMHNEWKQRSNLSQDTYRSIELPSNITDSYCQSARTDDNICSDSTMLSSDDDLYLLVHYLSDYDCYIDPKTGIFYESTL